MDDVSGLEEEGKAKNGLSQHRKISANAWDG
jgi:hypothetical protein